MMINLLKLLGPEISVETLRDIHASRSSSNAKRMMGKRSLNDEILLTNAMIRGKKQIEPRIQRLISNAEEEKDRIKLLYFDMFN